MLEVSKAFPQYQFVVAKAPGQEDAFYESLLQAYPMLTAVSDKTYHLLATGRCSAGNEWNSYFGNCIVWRTRSGLL